ncbi:hypothetical protein [Caballeronia sp. NK8]|uniref:hypothetical protein n=1 Tax=Caballeronia sp. NK8 TaxID=140098 RepID=UPI001CEDA452|nr:hypothetical protein [Caballeronia sp. NK8]
MTLVRNFLKVLLKILLFAGLFWLALRYVHTYPIPLTVKQQGTLVDIADRLGIRDYDGLYIYSMIALDLAVTIAVYVILMRLWQRTRAAGAE